MGFLDIWNAIKGKVVNAGSAVVGAAESVKKKVGSVAGKAKNIILRRDEKLQGVINTCVNDLKKISTPKSGGPPVAIVWFNSILSAFQNMIGDEKFKEFISKHSKEEKGLAGFANFLSKQLNGVEKLNESTYNDNIKTVKTKVFHILSRVRKYSGIGSRVKDFVAPCEKLYRDAINLVDTKGNKFNYFESARMLLVSAAAMKPKEKKEFYETMCSAYDAVCYMCKYEKLGKKNRGGKEENTASGKWYLKYDQYENKEKDDKIRAVLAICDDEYKSERGFAKRFLKFKGQTKWQELRTLVEKAKNSGIRIGVLDKDGKLVMKQSSEEYTSTFTSIPDVKEINDNNENKNEKDIGSSDNQGETKIDDDEE